MPRLRSSSFEMAKCFIQNNEHLIKLVVRNIHNIPSCTNEIDEHLLHDHGDDMLFTNVSLLDEYIGSSNHIVMNLKHYVGGGGVVVKTIIIFPLNYFYCVLEMKGNELVELLGSVKFPRSSNLDL